MSTIEVSDTDAYHYQLAETYFFEGTTVNSCSFFRQGTRYIRIIVISSFYVFKDVGTYYRESNGMLLAKFIISIDKLSIFL